MLYGIFHTLRPTDHGAPIRYGDAPGQHQTEALEDRIDSLELALAGLWRLLKTKHGATDEELIAAITEADGEDGKVDGRIRNRATDCPSCGRPLLTRTRGVCSWCGARFAGAGLVGPK